MNVTSFGALFKAELIWSLVRFNQGSGRLLSWLWGAPLNMEQSVGTLLMGYLSRRSAARLCAFEKNPTDILELSFRRLPQSDSTKLTLPDLTGCRIKANWTGLFFLGRRAVIVFLLKNKSWSHLSIPRSTLNPRRVWCDRGIVLRWKQWEA